jgi:cytochrome c553
VRLLLFTGLLLSAAACSAAEGRSDSAFTANGQVIAMSGGEGGASNACFSCHGLDGMGDGVSVPRLAGLDAGYLHKQLQDYAERTRPHPAMYEVARWLDDEDRRAVSAWYAALPVPEPAQSPKPAPEVWRSGRPSAGVPACASCHGLAGEGVGPGNPAVSGQPAAYTYDQLRRWKTGERRNDPREVMSDAVAGLQEEEMRAIAVWLETAPIARPPASDAASASDAAAAAARPEAYHGVRRPGR